MLDWLYNIFVTFVTFVMGLFGFNLKKRSVHFKDEIEEKIEEKIEETNNETSVLSVVNEDNNNIIAKTVIETI
jgi:hypothetical protein